MKTIMLILSLALFISFQSYSQLEFEGVINSTFKTIQLENGEMKYYNFNTKSQEIKLYNLDNSLWKTIQLSIDKNHFFEELLMVSQNIINPDANYEIVYTCLEYGDFSIEKGPDSWENKIEFTLNIIDESGQKILSIRNSQSFNITSSNGKNKLLIYKNIGRGFLDDNETLVYGLPNKK